MSTALIVLGSLDPHGLNARLAALAERAVRAAGWDATHADIADLPFYRPALDDEGVDPAVDAFRAALRQADAVVVVTPEHNGGTTGVLKNAIDIASRPRPGAPLTGKPVAVLGATPSPGGTRRARDQLIVHLTVAGAAPQEPTYGVAAAHSRLGEPEIADQVAATVRSLLEAAEAARLAA